MYDLIKYHIPEAIRIEVLRVSLTLILIIYFKL